MQRLKSRTAAFDMLSRADFLRLLGIAFAAVAMSCFEKLDRATRCSTLSLDYGSGAMNNDTRSAIRKLLRKSSKTGNSEK